jgi:hypothetical protein
MEPISYSEKFSFLQVDLYIHLHNLNIRVFHILTIAD